MKRHDVIMVGPTPPPFGGVANFIGETSTRLMARGHTVAVHRVGRRPGKKKGNELFQEIADTTRALWQNGFQSSEIAHIHSSSYASFFRSSYYLWLSKSRGCRTLLHIHGAEFDKFYRQSSKLIKWYIRRTLNLADAVVITGERWRSLFEHEIGVSQHPYVLENGYDGSAFRPGDKRAARARIGVDAEVPLLVNVANLEAYKGQSALLSAIAALRARGRRVQLVIIGDGPLRTELFSKVDQLNLPSEVHFRHGITRSEMIEWLHAADAFVLPSFAEGNPTVMFEALATGLPFIGTPVGGVPDVISPSNGCLVKPGDVSSLAAGIDAVLHRKWDGDIVRATVARNEWDELTTQLEAIYADILE